MHYMRCYWCVINKAALSLHNYIIPHKLCKQSTRHIDIWSIHIQYSNIASERVISIFITLKTIISVMIVELWPEISYFVS